MEPKIVQSNTNDIRAQIGRYPAVGTMPSLSPKGLTELFQGINQYDRGHQQKIAAYQGAQGSSVSMEENDPQFFRKKFIEYIQNHKCPSFNGDNATRRNQPEKAIITMEKLLGPKGVELYKLALEEEMHSTEFREAVLAKATTHFDGPKWLQRPVVIVAGPSGCGKSYAAQSAVETANQFLPTKMDDNSGNHVIAADGGIAREVSQMRKLAIQVANNHGYAGIKNLHGQSSILDSVKNKIKEAAFATPDVGVVIPETFSKWLNPLSPVKKLMKKIDLLENTKQIFTRVDGHDQSNFQKVVAFMGSRRAWNVDDEMPHSLDLNKTGLSESKAYGAKGFQPGREGSLLAEKWFKKHSKDKLSMIITNDLILLKPATKAGDWVPAVQGEKGARLFSESAFTAWKKETAHFDSSEPFSKDPGRPNLIDYCKTHAKPIIQTSAQIDFAIAQKQIDQRIHAIEKIIFKEHHKKEPNTEKVRALAKEQFFLKDMQQITLNDLRDETAIIHLKQQIGEQLTEKKATRSWRFTADATTTALNKINTALDKASQELQNAKPELIRSDSSSSVLYKTSLRDLKPIVSSPELDSVASIKRNNS